MSLVIFDLDNTLLGSDSDYEWGQFLVDKELVNKMKYKDANALFYDQYKDGTLDIIKYSEFSFTPLSLRSMEDLNKLHDEFMQEVIRPVMLDKAKLLIQTHKDNGDTLIIITATNSFITKPIAKEFGINNILATDPKIVDGRYTTEIEGTPCFKEGKITRLNQWLKENDIKMGNSVFYSDSINDLSLLEHVDTPVAVDPDALLREVAETRGWDIISLR